MDIVYVDKFPDNHTDELIFAKYKLCEILRNIQTKLLINKSKFAIYWECNKIKEITRYDIYATLLTIKIKIYTVDLDINKTAKELFKLIDSIIEPISERIKYYDAILQ